MSDRGRSSRRARSASPDPGKYQALADAPSSSKLPTPSPSNRARSASTRTSSFSLKPAGHETIQPGREHMNRARPYFNTLPTMKFIDGFFGEVDIARAIPDLDMSRIAVPRFGTNLVVGERRRQFARALCAVINASGLCPELQFIATSRLGSELHIQAYNVEDGTPATDVALPIYIRDDEYYDPVWDSSLRTDTDYDDIRQDLLKEYLHQFQIAPRTHIFSLEITGPCARLVRTDHAGMVGSVSFNWKEESYYLSEFLWRMGQLSNDGLGLDTTWSAATPEEIAVTLAAVQADDPEGDYSGALVKKLLLLNDAAGPDEQDGAFDVFAVLAHNFAPRPELVGRYTMGFRAYCPLTREVIWVKDSWTRSDTFFEPEGVTMRKLHAKGVPHIARVHSAGYVRAEDNRVQITLSGRPRFKSESVSEVVYTHYRIAYRDIGRPLSTFRSTRELVSAVCDAVQAHTSAYDTGVLHRDISQGNILINKDGRGMLIDWEMALDRDLLSAEQYDRARQHHCGTYAFLSTARLRSRIARQRWLHDVSDDLESFFWVLFAMIFRTRYVLHIPTSEGGWSPDDHYTMLGSIFRGNWGDGKLALLSGGAEPVTAEKFLQYGMDDVLSGRPAPEALVTLLGALWQGFARQHGPFDAPPASHRDEPENRFTAATILEVFNQALDSDGWFGDDGALQCNIIKTFRLRLPVDINQRLEAMSARIAEEAAVAAASASMATVQSEPKSVTGGVQRAKRGREDDEKENEEPEVASGDVTAKRRRKD